MNTAIVCAASSFRGVFIHGVLDAFNQEGFKPDAYAGASSLSIPIAYAAINKLEKLNSVEYWKTRVNGVKEYNFDMSSCIKIGIDMALPDLQNDLFSSHAIRVIIGISEVVTDEGKELTQTEKGSTKLGRLLMIAAAKKDPAWANKNLRPVVFDSLGSDEYQLNQKNMKDVFYATTRLLQGWKIPAWINDKAYIDGIYTCGCPVKETASLGFKKIIAISAETGELFSDMFGKEKIPDTLGDTYIYKIQPDFNLGEIGLDFLTATDEGLDKAYKHGLQKGFEFMKHKKENISQKNLTTSI